MRLRAITLPECFDLIISQLVHTVALLGGGQRPHREVTYLAALRVGFWGHVRPLIEFDGAILDQSAGIVDSLGVLPTVMRRLLLLVEHHVCVGLLLVHFGYFL